jgi:hypothetical protein
LRLVSGQECGREGGRGDASQRVCFQSGWHLNLNLSLNLNPQPTWRIKIKIKIKIKTAAAETPAL